MSIQCSCLIELTTIRPFNHSPLSPGSKEVPHSLLVQLSTDGAPLDPQRGGKGSTSIPCTAYPNRAHRRPPKRRVQPISIKSFDVPTGQGGSSGFKGKQA
jgi:hypothetical protein